MPNPGSPPSAIPGLGGAGGTPAAASTFAPAPAAPPLTLASFTGATAPTAATLYSNPAATGGFTVTPASSDPESGIAPSGYPALGGGWSNTAGAYTFAAAATDPSEPNNVTAVN